MNVRNRAVEFYRFLFSIVVCIFHFRTYTPSCRPFDSGYLAVEFFFILSGFFLAKSAERKRGSSVKENADQSLSFLIKRYKRLYPHYLFTVLCIAIVRIFVVGNLTVKAWLRKGISEILMLQSFGTGQVLSVVLWFSSAMVIASLIVYFVRLLNPALSTVSFPLISVAIYSYFLQTYKTIGATFSYSHLFSDGVWRAVAGIMIGCVCYDIVQWLKKYDFSRHKLLFTFAEALLVITIFTLLYRPAYREKNYILILLYILFVIILFSQKSYISGILDTRFSAFLGKISYAIYLNQIIVYMIFFNRFPADENTSMLKSTFLYLVIVIVLSVITTCLIDTIENILHRCACRGKSNTD